MDCTAHRGRIALALTLAMLAPAALAPPAARAQSGGPYDLRWSTLDGGGAPAMTGGGYGLAGTTGQPDAGPLSGGSYRLQGGFWNSWSVVTGVDPAPAGVPERFQVFAPSPNPFHNRAVVTFDLPREDRARVEVFSVAGQRVRLLLDETRPAGRHQMWWDGRDDLGHPVGQGVYFVRVAAGRGAAVKKLVRAE